MRKDSHQKHMPHNWCQWHLVEDQVVEVDKPVHMDFPSSHLELRFVEDTAAVVQLLEEAGTGLSGDRSLVVKRRGH